MSKKHDDPRGKQKGAQQHAEGQHGERTHERFLEELQAAGAEERDDVERRDQEPGGATTPPSMPDGDADLGDPGGHR